MSLLSRLLSALWPEPRYRAQPPPYMPKDHVIEGREIRGGMGRAPSGPKPVIKVVGQHRTQPPKWGGPGTPTPNWVLPPPPQPLVARPTKRRKTQ